METSDQNVLQPSRAKMLVQKIITWFEKPNLTSLKSIIGDKYTEICSDGEHVLFWISGNCVCNATLRNVVIKVSQKNSKIKPVTFTLAADGKIEGSDDKSVQISVDFLIVRGEINAPSGGIHAKHVIVESTAKINVKTITYEKLTVANGAKLSASLVHKEGK